MPDSIREAENVDVIVTVLEAEIENVVKTRRPFGLAKGKLVVPDDFDDPLPDDVLEEFYN